MTERRRLMLLLVIAALVLGALIARREYIGRILYRLDLPGNERVGPIPAPTAGQRILIFAPHEDDETLGCAGYIQRALQAGARVRIVMMTNGEYPEIDVVLFEDTLRMKPEDFIHLGYMRQKETVAAMDYLGVPKDGVTFLGYPNQYLSQMWLPDHWLPADAVRSKRTQTSRSPYSNSMTPGAVYCGESALRDVETVLRRYQPNVVITLHPNDIHVDHWPTYTLVRFALMELATRGEAFARDARVYTYLIHRDPWPVPRGYHPTLSLFPPKPLDDAGQTNWLVLPLTEREVLTKHRATGLYKTQGGSIDRLLLAFSRANELFGEIPARDWRDVPEAVVITDPTGDLKTNFSEAHADIRLVKLSRRDGRMVVGIETRGSARSSTCYRLLIHAGGANPADRIIAEYVWRGSQPTGKVFASGAVRTIDPAWHADGDIGEHGDSGG